MSWLEFDASVGYSCAAFIKISSLVLRLSGVLDIIDVENTNNDSNKCERIVKEVISEEVNGGGGKNGMHSSCSKNLFGIRGHNTDDDYRCAMGVDAFE